MIFFIKVSKDSKLIVNIFNPLLRRFLNADENIQDSNNTQNYNKYGYVMNNPLMYNDPDGEFWSWVIGAIAGSYISGVQANNGNWNPVKWDWNSTWTSVVGGAIAGAAVGQGISNINTYGTKFIQNSVVGAVGSIFNGIANGQNIFKSALIGFSGVNYSFSISGNNLTSTGIDVGYKYIVSSSEDYIGGGWDDLTKSILLNYVKENFCVSCSTGTLQQMTGTKFEDAFNAIMGKDMSFFNYTGNDAKIKGKYKGKPRNTIPDGIFDLIGMEVAGRIDTKMGIPLPKLQQAKARRFYGALFAEVKAMDGKLYNSSNQGQIAAMIGYSGSSYAVRKYGGDFFIGTTSDTFISKDIFNDAKKIYNIEVIQWKSFYRMMSGAMHVRFNSVMGNSSAVILK